MRFIGRRALALVTSQTTSTGERGFPNPWLTKHIFREGRHLSFSLRMNPPLLGGLHPGEIVTTPFYKDTEPNEALEASRTLVSVDRKELMETLNTVLRLPQLGR